MLLTGGRDGTGTTGMNRTYGVDELGTVKRLDQSGNIFACEVLGEGLLSSVRERKNDTAAEGRAMFLDPAIHLGAAHLAGHLGIGHDNVEPAVLEHGNGVFA